MAAKFYLSKSIAYPTVSDGISVTFVEAFWCAATGTTWATFATEDEKEQEALAKLKHIEEITLEDFECYDHQRKNRKDYSTIININTRGMATEMKGGGPAITVETPSVATLPPVEGLDNIIEARATRKK